MSKGNKIVIWFWIILILVSVIFLVANFRFVKKVAKAIFYQAKVNFSVPTEINQDENKRGRENYKIYSENKDINSIYVKESSGFESLNNQEYSSGKSFPLDNKIIIKINGEFKKFDITRHFKPGDIVKIFYEPYGIYIFIERYEADCGCFISYKEKIDIFSSE